MTLGSIVSERYARWTDALFRYGYIIETNPWLPTSAAAGTIGLRGRRRAELGTPHVDIAVAEIWTEGPDPDGLGLEQHACYLLGCGWHAQLEPAERGAGRLDVDRTKPPELIIHRHPYGSPNDRRTPEQVLPAPEAWLLGIEELSADLFYK